MESRASFPTVSADLLRGTDDNTKAMNAGSNNRGLRGVEQNTARGVKGKPEITGITPVEYAANTDAPEVIPFKTYGGE